MSKKKGLSIDEKIIKVEEWFMANPHPYTLKDLMVLIPKAKGVIHQSVEECIELLVSESRVSTEKIGINVFYWRFVPTNTNGGNTAKGLAALALPQLVQLKESLDLAVAEKNDLISQRRLAMGSSEERSVLSQKLSLLQEEKKNLEVKLHDLADQDPAVAQHLIKQSIVAKDAANRWTDNIFMIEQNVTKMMGMNQRTFRQTFDIPLQLDFI